MAKDSRNDMERKAQSKRRSEEIYTHSGDFLPPTISGTTVEKYSSKREILGYIFSAVELVLIFALIIAAFAFVFEIRSIEVIKSSDFPLEYSDEFIIESAGLSGYSNLLFADSNKISSGIKQAIPYAGVSKISKIYPVKIKIELFKAQPDFYTKLGDAYYAISDDFTVLAKTSDVDSLELRGAIYIASNKISRCVMGEKLAFSDMDMSDILSELDTLLDEYKLRSFTSEITLDSKFDISFLYQDRLRVKLGDLYDLDIKLQFFEKIVDTLDGTDSGIIDISDETLREAIVTKYQ